MKNRIGVITTSKDNFAKISGTFPDGHFHYAKNVMEFVQIIGSQKPDLIIFHAPDMTTEADLLSSLKFLRSKATFQKTPVLILSVENGQKIKTPFRDPLIRSFHINDNLFLDLLDFLGTLKNPENLEKPFQLDGGVLENAFTTALQKKMGLTSQIQVRPATDDEMHASFFCQTSSEISTSLFWVKFTARILESGNPAFAEMFRSFSESEKDEMSEKLLSSIMIEFRDGLLSPVQKAGAIPFPGSDELEFEQRKPFVKSAINRALVFESEVCRLVLESTQYI